MLCWHPCDLIPISFSPSFFLSFYRLFVLSLSLSLSPGFIWMRLKQAGVSILSLFLPACSPLLSSPLSGPRDWLQVKYICQAAEIITWCLITLGLGSPTHPPALSFPGKRRLLAIFALIIPRFHILKALAGNCIADVDWKGLLEGKHFIFYAQKHSKCTSSALNDGSST